MVDRTLKREIKALIGAKQMSDRSALREKLSQAAQDLKDNPQEKEKLAECVKKHGRAVVAICIAQTLKMREFHVGRWEREWVDEVLGMIPGEWSSILEAAYIADEMNDPTKICLWANGYLKFWRECA